MIIALLTSCEESDKYTVVVDTDDLICYVEYTTERKIKYIHFFDDAFDANITAHKWHDGIGRIYFDKPITTIDSFFLSSDQSLLESVIIPNSVTTIESSAFSDCSSLTSVNLGNSVKSIGNYAFDGCSSLTSINIPDSVTSIGYNAFRDCSSLKSVTIGNSVTSIGSSAFSDCSSLTSVNLGNSVMTIGYNAFYNCDSLTSIDIPDSVTSIGSSAFSDCSSLKSVTIGNGVTSIENGAFESCYNLASVYCKATTPPSLGYSSYFTFYENASGRKIYVPRNSVDAYKSAAGWKDYAAYIVGYDFE